MKIVTLIISLSTLVCLVISFVNEQQTLTVKQSTISQLESIAPAIINNEHLLVEKTWHQLKADRTKPQQNNEKNKSNVNQETLLINDKKYVLYGIFNAQNTSKQNNQLKSFANESPSAFILIKAESEPMQKIVVGAELTAGVTLLTVNTNAISFKTSNEIIKFKLFERKSDV